MSATLLNSIPAFSPADYQDNDTYGEDCTSEMGLRQTTIASIGTPIVTRVDLVPMGLSDMTISGVTIQAGGLKFQWQASGGQSHVTYQIRFPITLANGDFINRAVLIPVLAAVG